MKKKLILRGDGNRQTGLGHLFRLLAVAEATKSSADIIFITHESSEKTVIPSEYDLRTLQCAPEEEAEWLAANFSPKEFRIILDGYHFTENYQKALKHKGYFLIYIDDLIEMHMYADVVINHSPGISASVYSAEKYVKFALGTHYALLRSEFSQIARKKRENLDLSSVFLCLGGADPGNLTERIVKLLFSVQSIRSIHVVVGAAYKGLIPEMQGKEVKQYRNISAHELIGVMLRCGSALLPTSTVLFEACCVKMAIISGFHAKNQENAYREFLKLGLTEGIGDLHNVNQEDIEHALEHIQKNGPEKYLNAQQQFFDGKQSERIKDLVLS